MVLPFGDVAQTDFVTWVDGNTLLFKNDAELRLRRLPDVYILVLGLPSWLNFGFIAFFNILIFVPIKYIYPSRTVRLRKLTLALTYAFGVLGAAGLLLYPNEPKWIWWLTLLSGVYYFAASLWPGKQDEITT
ncbi:MAG: hypothetical protein ACUVRJ_08155 [Candidatus Villigracilaceae bacterium]